MSLAHFKTAMPEDEDRSSNAKRIKYTWHVVLASELSPLSCEDTESICSIQEAETVFAYDTEDTSTNKSTISSYNADDSIHEEYEPISLSEDENLLVVDSSSDTEIQDNKFLSVGVTAAIDQQVDFDSCLADDDSDNDSRMSFDSEISFAHYRTCFQCNTSNNDPKFPYCHKCYTERKNHLPPRPRGKKRRKKLSRIAASQNRSLTVGFKKIDIENPLNMMTGSSQRSLMYSQESVDTVDSGISLSQPGTIFFSQSSCNSIERLETTRVENRSTEKASSQESVGNLASSTKVFVGSRESANWDSNENDSAEKRFVTANRTTIDQTNPEKLKCKICRDAPRNIGLVHNRSMHIACCYPCAKTVWRTTKRCPICNRKIVNYLHAYFA